MANGKILYPAGDISPTTYTFVKNPDFGHKPKGRVNLTDRVRTLDGTGQSYCTAIKKKYELTFSYVLEAQADFFKSLWDLQCDFDLYLDGTNKDATVFMTEAPDPESQKAFVNGEWTYTFTVVMEQV